MKSISAPYTTKCITRIDNLHNHSCALCHTVVLESDLFVTYAEGAETHVDCCEQCLNSFTEDSGIELDSDVVPSDTFAIFHKWCLENMSPADKESDAPSAAAFLGGRMWQSGGGIALVLIGRADGTLCVVSGDCAAVYKSPEAFHEGTPPLRALNFRA